MIDTVKLYTPMLSEALGLAAEQAHRRLLWEEIKTGEQLALVTTAELEGSYDHRLRCRVDWHEVPEGRKAVLTMEGSVHKALLGHNCFGGSLDPVASCRWFVAEIGRRLGVELPDGRDCYLQRLDWAEVYDLQTAQNVQEYIYGLNHASYPRRTVNRRGNQSIWSSGQMTGIKAYHKGAEYAVHDFKRLRNSDINLAVEVYDKAQSLLRWEVSILTRKLRADFEKEPLVSKMTVEYFQTVHDEQVDKFLRESSVEMETVRNLLDVRARLDSLHKPRTAQALFAAWVQMSTLGEDQYKASLGASAKSTFYKYRSLLMASGVSWHSTDVMLRDVPTVLQSFTPRRDSPYRLTEVAREIDQQLSSYAA